MAGIDVLGLIQIKLRLKKLTDLLHINKQLKVHGIRQNFYHVSWKKKKNKPTISLLTEQLLAKPSSW